MATWVIGYGIVQGFAPKLTGNSKDTPPDGRHAMLWALALAIIPAIIALSLYYQWNASFILVAGLLLFGALFAVNSSLHSYLIVSYAGKDGVSLDVGFYYMANAMGRLIGTVLSGWIYQEYGLGMCLGISTLFIAITAVISVKLPRGQERVIRVEKG